MITSSHVNRLMLECRWDALISHPPEGDWQKIAPLRILSFDIECAGRKGIFPEANSDPVIQIANMVTIQGKQYLQRNFHCSPFLIGEKQPFIRNVFTLNTCSHIVGSEVLSYDNEAQMLQEWKNFIVKVDPDVVIGYNVANFDFPYLIDRAKHLKANNFPYLSRLKRGFCPPASFFTLIYE